MQRLDCLITYTTIENINKIVNILLLNSYYPLKFIFKCIKIKFNNNTFKIAHLAVIKGNNNKKISFIVLTYFEIIHYKWFVLLSSYSVRYIFKSFNYLNDIKSIKNTIQNFE